jgi:hypothetical protein
VLVQGSFMMDAQNPRSSAAVQLTDTWGDPSDSYRLQFIKDYLYGGHNVVYFKSLVAGNEIETEIGAFELGVWLEWMLCLDTVGCEVWLDQGSGWVKVLDVVPGDFDFRINIHGSGDVPGTGDPNTSYWDNILVHTETACPVSASSWSLIKAMFR